jgi:hypothetical protein
MLSLTVVAGILLLALIWLGLALRGVVNHLEDLERRLEVVISAMPGKVKRTGLRVGSPVPEFDAETLRGERISSATLSGVEHLILFAHPGCAPCEQVVPLVLEEADRGRLPPTVVVSAGSAEDHPPAWTEPAERSDRARLVVQERSAIARRFETFITPHLFVVGADERVLAQGIAGRLEEVRALIKKSQRHERRPATIGSRGASDG